MTLDNPAAVEERLAEVENELAELQNQLESAALAWFRIKKLREHSHAKAFIKAEGTAAERTAIANRDTAEEVYETAGESLTAWEAEGRYEGLKAKSRVLDTRAAIGMSLLRAQSRVA